MITLVLAVAVFPKSASHEAADTMSAALQGLMQLYALAWNMDWSEEDKTSNGYHRQNSDSGGCVHHRVYLQFSASLLKHLTHHHLAMLLFSSHIRCSAV